MKKTILALAVVWAFALLTWPALSSAAPAASPRPDLGHVLLLTSETQIYVRVDDKSVIFSGLMPSAWSYSINVDANVDGVWGYGRYDQAKEKTARPKSDFAYAANSDGTICTQYIYSGYADSPDVIYSTSDCGRRKSAATFRTGQASNGLTLQVYAIPRAELRGLTKGFHFVIEVWDGSASRVFGSPTAPFVLKL